jgi:hypothetical protein
MKRVLTMRAIVRWSRLISASLFTQPAEIEKGWVYILVNKIKKPRSTTTRV